MTLPLLGPMTLSGFSHAWFFVFLLVILGLVALYIIAQVARQRRMLRFANMELLESVAPKQPTRWRHLSAIQSRSVRSGSIGAPQLRSVRATSAR